MSGVNDLASTLRANTAFQAKGDYRAASLVDEIARTAWKPVSEPPTEADAGGYMVDPSCVLILNDEGKVGMSPWWSVSRHVRTIYWARINDVILMPGGE